MGKDGRDELSNNVGDEDAKDGGRGSQMVRVDVGVIGGSGIWG